MSEQSNLTSVGPFDHSGARNELCHESLNHATGIVLTLAVFLF